ncbi:MAG: helix-turn-helix transcriptional regulator [Clostridia bacterium]|nr:helix-turn-helix transcriptional regulator [Clostridia bacterium]
MISRKFNGMANVIGTKIQKLRKSKNWSRSDLSNKLMMLGIDINYDSIYKIEKSKRIVKDFELSALAKVLDTTESDLLQDFKKSL